MKESLVAPRKLKKRFTSVACTSKIREEGQKGGKGRSQDIIRGNKIIVLAAHNVKSRERGVSSWERKKSYYTMVILLGMKGGSDGKKGNERT